MIQRLILLVLTAVVGLGIYVLQQPRTPDPRLIDLSVRATVFAMPTPTPRVIEVTRVVEVTRMVEVVRVEVATPTPVPTATPTPVAAAPTPVPAANGAQVALAAAVSGDSGAQPENAASSQTFVQQEQQLDPVVDAAGGGCPAASGRQYSAIPVAGGGTAHPDSLHGDLNLALRGYVASDAAPALVQINGPSDGDAPQLSAIFQDGRQPVMTRTFRARDWQWGCGDHGCRGEPLHHVAASVVGLQSSPGEPVHAPSRGPEIYGGGYVALVLYAEPTRLTLGYTREDSVANGYAVHLESICVDPNLVALYRQSNAAGRGALPAVHNGEPVGTAQGAEVLVAVRDRGAFRDPRSRKDWWQGS